MTDGLTELAVRALIACIAVTWLVILWRGHRDSMSKNFSFQSLIMTKEGYMDRVAFMELGSWLVFGLILAWLTVHGDLTEGYALIWVGWPAVRAGVVSTIKALATTQPQIPTTTTTTDTHEVSVKGTENEIK